MDPSSAPQELDSIITISPGFHHLDLTRNREYLYVKFTLSRDMSDHSGNIAFMEGHLVNRAQAVQAGFRRAMEDIGTVCSTALARVIFDAYGQLQLRWCLGAGQGSGIWDARINFGNFLMIDWVEVEEQYRRRGFAKDLVSGFLNNIRADGPSYVFTDVGELKGAARKDAIEFWREVGFKRIGLSHVFCYAMSMDDESKIPDVETDIYDSEDSHPQFHFSSSAQSDEVELSPQSLASGELNESDNAQLPSSDDNSASEHSNSLSPSVDDSPLLLRSISRNVQSSHTSIEGSDWSTENSSGEDCSGDDSEDGGEDGEDEDGEDVFYFSDLE